MKNFENKVTFSVPGSIAGGEKMLLPILQDAERTGSFAVSLNVKIPAAGTCIALRGVPAEYGRVFTVKETVACLYRVVENRVADFYAVVCGLVKTACSGFRSAYKTFRRGARNQNMRMHKVVLLSCAGGLRL